MIPRYSRSEMTQIWEPSSRFKIWLEIELLALEAMAKKDLVPKEVVKSVRSKAHFSISRIDTLEREVKHEVIAFLTCVSEYVGEPARYLHRGLTSSDIMDTGFAVQLVQSADQLLAVVGKLLSVLKMRAFEFKNTPMIGRSHGVHAEPITFGLKLALWHAEMERMKGHLEEARKTIAVGKLSGAVGTFAHVDPEVEEFVCKKLGLVADPVSNQIIQRDRHAFFFSTLALVGSSIDKIATEIRHLQRTEVLEVEEFFSEGQKGSSAMPHKRNPVLSENLSGLARLLRGYSVSALENVALWHERDISHSSVERVIGPDATITLDFMLHRITGLLESLIVYPETMQKNLNQRGGLVFSQRVLLALTDAGLARDDAYKIVQDCAMKVLKEGGGFLEEVAARPQVAKLIPKKELEGLFDPSYYLRNVDVIFRRVFGS